MYEVKSLLGTRVVIRPTGVTCGVVLDVVIDEKTDTLVGLVISDSSPAEVILFTDISSVTAEAVYIEDTSVIATEDASPAMHASLHGVTRLKGKAVCDASGQEVGHVRNYYFDEKSGNLLGYETKELKHTVVPFFDTLSGPVDPAAPETLNQKKQEAEELFSHIGVSK